MAAPYLLESFQNDDDYCQFLSEEFDAKKFACKAVEMRAITETLAKLSAGINMLDRELHSQVAAHHEELLAQATGIQVLENVLQSLQTSIRVLQSDAERLRSRIDEPYNRAKQQSVTLHRLQGTCETVRKIARVAAVARRLRGQLNAEGEGKATQSLIKAAQSLNEAEHLVDGDDMEGIGIIADDLRYLRESKDVVRRQAEEMLRNAMRLQNVNQIGTALQVLYNLNLLRAEMNTTMQRVCEKDVRSNIRETLDVQGRLQSTQKPAAPGVQATANMATFRAILWQGVDTLTGTLYDVVLQMHVLESVLTKRRDSITHALFMTDVDPAITERSSITAYLWLQIINILKEELNSASKESPLLKQAFENEYPKLLNSMTILWKKVSALEVSSEEREILQDVNEKQEQLEEKVDYEERLRDALRSFETTYLSRSLSRLLDSVNLAVTTIPPTQEDVEGVLRVIFSELKVSDTLGPDSRLTLQVAHNVAKTLRHLGSKCDVSQVIDALDADATQVIGPPTALQKRNAVVLQRLQFVITQMEQFLAHEAAEKLSKKAIDDLKESVSALGDVLVESVKPLLQSVEEAIEAIVLTMHNEDFTEEANPDDALPNAPCSLYMRELQEFITRAQSHYFALFPPEALRINVLIKNVAARAIELFVRHASLVRPLGEGGRLRLAADFAQLELAVTPLCAAISSPTAGENLTRFYKLLRGFRPLLFQIPEHIAASPSIGEVVPYSLALHHLFSRAPPELKSPHEAASWSTSRYSKWLDEHGSERDRLVLIRGCLDSYVQYARHSNLKQYPPIYLVINDLLQKALAREKA